MFLRMSVFILCFLARSITHSSPRFATAVGWSKTTTSFNHMQVLDCRCYSALGSYQWLISAQKHSSPFLTRRSQLSTTDLQRTILLGSQSLFSSHRQSPCWPALSRSLREIFSWVSSLITVWVRMWDSIKLITYFCIRNFTTRQANLIRQVNLTSHSGDYTVDTDYFIWQLFCGQLHFWIFRMFIYLHT